MDTQDVVAAEAPVEKPFLVETKLYRMNADENFLDFLQPDPVTQMQVEQILAEAYPREEGENEDTRIFVNFTNLNGNGTSFLITDDQRLARRFDMDAFINQFFATVNKGVSEEIVLEVVRPSLVNAINTAVMNALELNEEKTPPAVKVVSENILKSLIAILYNDPLDVMILLQEQPPREGETETDALVVGIWATKTRDPA